MAEPRSFPASMALVPMTVALLMTAACSPGDPAGQSDAGQAAPREFSAAEREAAATLSIIAGTGSAQAGDDPLDRALRCHAALAGLREGFGESDILSEAQMTALSQAEQFFERRVQEQAGAGGSAAQIAGARRAVEQERISIADEARVALGCVRELQQ